MRLPEGNRIRLVKHTKGNSNHGKSLNFHYKQRGLNYL